MTACDRVLTVAVAAMVLLAGCGADEATTPTPPNAPSAATGTPTETGTEWSAPLVIDVTIESGEVDPTNTQLQAAVAQPIEIRVTSDSVDELHVHSTPEHTFEVGVGPGQTFEFTVQVPGRVDVELHELNRTIATIQVR